MYSWRFDGWYISIGSGNGLVVSGNKRLPAPLLTSNNWSQWINMIEAFAKMSFLRNQHDIWKIKIYPGNIATQKIA